MTFAIAALIALGANTTDEARRVAARIDAYIADALDKNKAKAAPLADDAAFFRRLSLDVAGKIPAASDVRRFLADGSEGKRAVAVEKMLDSVGYANHMTQIWLGLLLLYLFAVQVQWVAVGGPATLTQAILPALTLALLINGMGFLLLAVGLFIWRRWRTPTTMLLVATIFTIVNLGLDILFVQLDPRIKYR